MVTVTQILEHIFRDSGQLKSWLNSMFRFPVFFWCKEQFIAHAGFAAVYVILSSLACQHILHPT